MTRRLIVVAFCCAIFSSFVLAASTTREQVDFQGKKRTIYLHVPKSLASGQPAPLLVLLHGSGHVGKSMTDEWEGYADKEGIVLAAPNSLDPNSWISSQ